MPIEQFWLSNWTSYYLNNLQIKQITIAQHTIEQKYCSIVNCSIINCSIIYCSIANCSIVNCSIGNRWLGPLAVGQLDLSQTTINPNHNESKPQWIQAIGVWDVIIVYTREERSDRVRWRLGPLAVGQSDLSQTTIYPNHNESKPQWIQAIGVWNVIFFCTRQKRSDLALLATLPPGQRSVRFYPSHK